MGSYEIFKVLSSVVFQLIYTCALLANFGSSELDKIAVTSRLRNKAKNLTGILLCKEGSVLQVLEGDKNLVLELYERISKDPRVSNPIVLFKRTTSKREFPNWSMGYRNADTNETCFDLTALSFPDAMPENVSPEIDTIGRTFARVNGLN